MTRSNVPTARPARLWHLPQLARILWGFTRRTDWLPVGRSYGDDLRILAQIIRRGWVQISGASTSIKGFIARDGAVIHALYVCPSARGAGHGAALIAKAKSQVSRLELWTEQANVAAQSFYRAQGFNEVARSDGRANDEHIPDVYLVWKKDNSSNEVSR